ncbi:DUF4625 domain-containing protein [Carboxylicivirga sp. M1479]|uniref:DUF4625 domain-containing protein n=1 Tax=Carboxylicivirga sp. M1479 TaxID=2594476 RepID=UPI0011785A9F|nr:DUF4625 domain-containing protein [Carboxylicivirga sp. M1479]TRX71142.1 DUF4625 domain-containing protein [Carboxylicivirga sp. M1479]
MKQEKGSPAFQLVFDVLIDNCLICKEMMKKLMSIISIWAIMFILISCSKSNGEDPQPVDEHPPTMNITSPTSGASIPKGANLILEGIFEDDIALKELKVSLIAPEELKALNGIKDPWAPADNVIALTGTKHILEAYLLFNENVPADCLSGTYKLLLELIDAKEKVTTKTIDIVVF